MKLMFCMFAEDIELLPSKLFSKSVQASRSAPERLAKTLRALFEAMAHGGMLGADEILYFNGGLFADAEVIDLTAEEIKVLAQAADFDWSVVEPHIFGTLLGAENGLSHEECRHTRFNSAGDIIWQHEPAAALFSRPHRRGDH